MSEPKKINIQPGIKILSVLSKLNYSAWNALAEYIDNSIQSYENEKQLLSKMHDGYKLIIEISFNQNLNTIKVKDNSTGISIDDFERAFKIAALPPDTSGKNEFGMGMKSASCWFSHDWKVITKYLNDDYERTIHFDVNNITENELLELDYKEKPVDKDLHYTEIVLEDVQNMPRGKTINKIKTHLTDIYRKYLKNDSVRIYLDQEKLMFEPIPILKATKYYGENDEKEHLWKKFINFSVEEVKVNGFAGIMDPGNRKRSGFALFRRNRIILGSGKDGYKPSDIFGSSNSFQSFRLFGELNIENIDVSHTKDGFKWDEIEDDIIDKLKNKLDEGDIKILEQTKKYRKSDEEEKESVVKKSTDDIEKSLLDEKTKNKLEEDTTINVYSDLKDINLFYDKKIEIEVNNKTWTIIIEFSDEIINNDNIFDYKNFEINEDGAEIKFRIPLNNAFISKYLRIGDFAFEAILKIITSLILARSKSLLAGIDVEIIDHYLYIFNDLLNTLSINE